MTSSTMEIIAIEPTTAPTIVPVAEVPFETGCAMVQLRRKLVPCGAGAVPFWQSWTHACDSNANPSLHDVHVKANGRHVAQFGSWPES